MAVQSGYQTRIFDVMEDTVAKLNELGGVNIYGNTDFPGFGKIQFARRISPRPLTAAK